MTSSDEWEWSKSSFKTITGYTLTILLCFILFPKWVNSEAQFLKDLTVGTFFIVALLPYCFLMAGDVLMDIITDTKKYFQRRLRSSEKTAEDEG